MHDENILNWIEEHLYLVSLGPRHSGYDVLNNTEINKENASALSTASEKFWEAISEMDLKKQLKMPLK